MYDREDSMPTLETEKEIFAKRAEGFCKEGFLPRQAFVHFYQGCPSGFKVKMTADEILVIGASAGHGQLELEVHRPIISFVKGLSFRHQAS